MVKRMKRLKISSKILAALLLTTAVARADVAVLVHGWNSNAETWMVNGVVPVMRQHGWEDAGVYAAAPSGMQLYPTNTASGNKLYRTNLPAEAPLLIQASLLFNAIAQIRQQHLDESLTLVGHSAGGLVARLVTVRGDAPKIDRLVTIATPNLGTPRAIEGLDIVDSKPFFCPGPGIDFLKSMVGGNDYDYLKYSRGALIDMTPGALTVWLNQQPHPQISYHTIIRTDPNGQGDSLVPAFSQDLNQVSALRGRAERHITLAGHSLNPADGNLLAKILK